MTQDTVGDEPGLQPAMSPAPRRGSSIREVARRAGVSETTVSHALSGKRHVAPGTAARIQTIVKELGYVPHFAARTLQTRRSSIIGLVIPEISNQFFGQIAYGVEYLANRRDHGVVLGTSQSDRRREKRYFNMLRSGALDGLIFNPADVASDTDLVAIAAGFPLVIIDEQVTGLESCPLVSSDHRQGGLLAGAHLRRLGHEHVAVFHGPPGLLSSRDRTEGISTVFPDAILLAGDYSEPTGERLAAIVAANYPEVTAIFAGNDLMAFGAIAEFARRGLHVPQDISVIGFDDIDFARRLVPALTTIRQPASDIGKRAAGLLLDHLILGAELGPQRVSLPVELIERHSTGSPRPLGKGAGRSDR